jgi:hypothetical protein
VRAAVLDGDLAFEGKPRVGNEVHRPRSSRYLVGSVGSTMTTDARRSRRRLRSFWRPPTRLKCTAPSFQMNQMGAVYGSPFGPIVETNATDVESSSGASSVGIPADTGGSVATPAPEGCGRRRHTRPGRRPGTSGLTSRAQCGRQVGLRWPPG